MTKEDDAEPEDGAKVGYKQPPTRTRFPPGKSGNPNGRPRRTKSRRQIVEEVAGEAHRIIEDGKVRYRSTFDLVLLSLRNKSSAGDVAAIRLYQQFWERFGTQEALNGAKYLVVPEQISAEEWDRRFGNPAPGLNVDPYPSAPAKPTEK